jgi:hypothetical protein
VDATLGKRAMLVEYEKIMDEIKDIYLKKYELFFRNEEKKLKMLNT